jgi:hypothetical protein
VGATSGAGTTYPSGTPEFTLSFNGVRVTPSLVLCVCFVDSDYPFSLKPFLDIFFGITDCFFSLRKLSEIG